MNIYVTDVNPKIAATHLDDARVIQMILESSQIMSTALHRLHVWNNTLYRPVNEHHPCCAWAALSVNNYRWLYHYGIALCDEYSFRFSKVGEPLKHHGGKVIIKNCYDTFQANLDKFPSYELTEFFNGTPYKSFDVDEAYREYLTRDKWDAFSTWTRRSMPWFHPVELNKKRIAC